jgi:hypothetical protein
MRSEADLGHLGVGDFDSRFVVFVDQIALHDEAWFRFGGADELEGFSMVVRSSPARLLLMWLNRRCSMGFHLEAPGG